MTENKQFTFDRDTVAPNIKTPIVFKEEGERLSIGEVLDKLNDLYEENQELLIEKDTIQKQHLYELTKKLEYKSELIDLKKENEQLKEKLKKYEEIEELKKEDFINCHNCKHDRSVHDGVALDGMCAIKELMNLDGYFDTEYHKLPSGTICPCWELEE